MSHLSTFVLRQFPTWWRVGWRFALFFMIYKIINTASEGCRRSRMSCTLIFEETLVFIEIDEQLQLFPVCAGIGSWGRRGLGRPDISGSMTAYLDRTILYGWYVCRDSSGARSSYISCVVSLKSRVIPRCSRTRVLQGIRVDHPSRMVGLVEPVGPKWFWWALIN
jgi:hypothetical protein